MSRKDKTRSMIVTSSDVSLYSTSSAEKNGLVTNNQQPTAGVRDVSASRDQAVHGSTKIAATVVSQTAAPPRF